MLRFSSGMIPLGSLSWANIKYVNDRGLHTGNNRKRASGFFTVTEKLSCTHCGVLKVVQTVVCEDEPPPLPGFDSSPCGVNSQCQRGSAERERERNEHRSAGSSSRQADRCMGRQTDDGSRGHPAIHPDPPLHHAHTITTTA